MKPRRAMLSILGGLSLVISLPIRAEDKPVRLARTFKKGEVVRYKAEAVVNANGTEVVATTTDKATVKEVKDNGQVVIEGASEGGKVKVGEMNMDIPASPPQTITRDKSGKLIELKMDESAQGLTTPELTRLLATLTTPILGDKAVKPGDSWETEADNPAAKGKKVKLKTTFIGIEKVEGVDYWKVKQKADAETDANGTKMSYDATYWLDTTNGQEAKSESDIKGLPTMFGVLDMKTTITRLKADAK